MKDQMNKVLKYTREWKILRPGHPRAQDNKSEVELQAS